MVRTLYIRFRTVWLSSPKAAECGLNVDSFIKELSKKIVLELKNVNIAGFRANVLEDELEDEKILGMVNTVLAESFDIQNPDEVLITCRLKSYESPKFEEDWFAGTDIFCEEITDVPEIKTETKEEIEAKKQEEIKKIKEEIDAIVGAGEFKDLIEECMLVAPGLIEHNVVDAFLNRCYLFSINDGSGLSTCLQLFADLLGKLGLIEKKSRRSVYETSVQYAGAKELDPFARVCSIGDTKGQVVCIDISEWMSSTHERHFRDFLESTAKRSPGNVMVFRVPFVEKDVLNRICESLNDSLSVKPISFVPLDSKDLRVCAESQVKKYNYEFADDVWQLFDARIAEEKMDGRFYGINTIDKIIKEMIYLKHIDNAKNGVDDKIIKKSEVEKIVTRPGDDKYGLEMLDSFVGMSKIKEKVNEIICQIEMSMKDKNLGAPCIHMRFVGNPGTGKTTVARIIGKVLKERGVLRNGGFFEYAGRDFCGRYIGETAPKTLEKCRDAYGSVMFIDEAYSLYRGEGTSKNDYGREVIDTLIAEMENHRKDLVVIMAGYPDEMAELMKANAGLASRMPYIIEFPNYTRAELLEIFMGMARKSFECAPSLEVEAKKYFDSLSDELIYSKEFSNARFVRNLFERTWAKGVLRSQVYKSEKVVLTAEDFIAASSENEFRKNLQKTKKSSLGFI